MGRTDTCSTLATFSMGTARSKLLRRSSSLSMGPRLTFSEYLSLIVSKKVEGEG